MANVGICENHFGGKMELILSVVEERRTGNLGFLVVPNHPTVAFIVGSEGPILLSAFVRDPMWMMVENIAGLLCSRRGTRHLIELANWVERTLTIGVTPAEKCYTLSADPHKCLASYPLADMELHLWDIGCAAVLETCRRSRIRPARIPPPPKDRSIHLEILGGNRPRATSPRR